MSIYSELLEVSMRLGESSSGEVGDDRVHELLRVLAECRHRLVHKYQYERLASRDVSSDLAAQLDYDMALIRLCRLRGIDCSPAGFTPPILQRRRLEGELRATGIELGP